jgi:hypothetical protein
MDGSCPYVAPTLALMLFFMCAGLWITYSAAGVPNEFDESFWIGAAMVLYIQTFFWQLPVLYSPQIIET